jgi:hypothetical protein
VDPATSFLTPYLHHCRHSALRSPCCSPMPFVTVIRVIRLASIFRGSQNVILDISPPPSGNGLFREYRQLTAFPENRGHPLCVNQFDPR